MSEYGNNNRVLVQGRKGLAYLAFMCVGFLFNSHLCRFDKNPRLRDAICSNAGPEMRLKWHFRGVMPIFSLHYVSGTFTIMNKYVNSVGNETCLFENNGKISPGTVLYVVEGSSIRSLSEGP